jgi:hypothetical protein
VSSRPGCCRPMTEIASVGGEHHDDGELPKTTKDASERVVAAFEAGIVRLSRSELLHLASRLPVYAAPG